LVDLMAEQKGTAEALQAELGRLGAVHSELSSTAKGIKYENGSLKQLNDELRHSVVAKLEAKMAHLDQQLRAECTEHDALRQRWNRLEAEYTALNDGHNKLDDKNREIQADNVELEQRVETLEDAVDEHKNMVSATESKLKSSNAAIETLENVLGVYKSKELEAMKLVNSLKANHSLFVNVERDRLLAQKEALSKQVASLKQQKLSLLAEGECFKKEVEDKLTLRFQQRQQALTQSLQDMTTRNAVLSTERQRFKTRGQVVQRETDQIKAGMLKKFDALKSTENELKCKLKHSELEKERVSEMAQRKEKELTQQTKLWKSERELLGQTIAELNRNDDKKNLTLIQDQEAILDLNERIEKLSERLQVEGSRNSKLTQSLQAKLVQNEAAFKSTIEHYKVELGKFENLYSESQAMTKEIISKHETLSTKWKEENRNSFTINTNIIDALKRENKSLLAANLTLRGQHDSLCGNQRNTVAENEKMNKKLLNAQKTNAQMADHIENVKAINEGYRKKETLLLTENKNLRNELSKSQIGMQRLQRNHQFNAKINSH